MLSLLMLHLCFANVTCVIRITHSFNSLSHNLQSRIKAQLSSIITHQFVDLMNKLHLLVLLTLLAMSLSAKASSKGKKSKQFDTDDYLEVTRGRGPTGPSRPAGPGRGGPNYGSIRVGTTERATLTVTGTAQLLLLADTIKMGISINSQNINAVAALAANLNATNSVNTAIAGLQIPEDSVSTTRFTITPLFPGPAVSTSSPVPPFAGFSVTNDLEITLSSIAIAGQLSDAIVALGSTISYINFIADPETMRDAQISLTVDAVRDAFAIAKISAKEIQSRIVGIVSVNVNNDNIYYFSTPYFYPNTPSNQQVNQSVTITFLLK